MGNKYSRLQISTRWLVFLLVIVAYYTMEFRGFFPCSGRPLINMIHVSCGISVLILMVVRPLLGLKRPTPPTTPKLKPMMTGLAHLGHLATYLLFVALSAVGLVMIYSRGNPWFAFGSTMPYALEANLEQVDSLRSWHETLTNLGYLVVGSHAAAALVHHYF